MKNILKQEKGVTLISLAVVIIILGIIISMLLYSVKDTNDVTKLTNLYSDIDNLTDKISNYYSKYGKIPAFEKQGLNEKVASLTNSPIGVNDTGNFLVIDLNAIENLTLNYGQDFKNIKENELGNNTDLYIINENSHNIFYLKGIKIENKMYYTNGNRDTQKLNLYYIDGIRIPEGYTYKSGDRETEIIITDSENKEFIWADVEKNKYTITQNGNNIIAKDDENHEVTLTVDDNDEFLKSVDAFGGFYLSVDNSVAYVLADETNENNWSKAYDIETTYVDKNGDTAYIPQGFKVSKLSTLNTINKGLVIKNATTGDEYVWIRVPTRILKDLTRIEDIEKALQEYSSDYKIEGCEDKWYEGCGIATETAYNELKNTMLQSIKTNGGFYVGRYEAGVGNDTPRSSSADSSGIPISKKDQYCYSWITVDQAQPLATQVTCSGRNTSLMFGLQWNLICKFIEESGMKTKDEIMKDSSSWGNYKNAGFFVKNVEGKEDYNGNTQNLDVFEKGENVSRKLSTGITDRNKVLNIYDLAGNMNELTLELQTNTNKVVLRGGDSSQNGAVKCFSYFSPIIKENNYAVVGFRVTIF